MTTPRSTRLTGTTTAIFALLGLIDLALLGVVEFDVIAPADKPPLVISLGVAALGLITLIALVPAYRGSHSALLTIVVVRIISALLAVPPLLLHAPVGVMIVEGFVIVCTIAALILLRSPRLPRPEAA
jgi:hypothetical protein